MSRLSDRQVRVLATAWVLAATEAGEALSAFERELLMEVGRRYLDHGAMTSVTGAEWDAIECACEGLVRRTSAGVQRDVDLAGRLAGVRLAASVQLGPVQLGAAS